MPTPDDRCSTYTHTLPAPRGTTIAEPAPTELICYGPADPDGAVRHAERHGEAHPGFWANLWPASRALADWCAKTLMLPDDALVVEIGCGLALPSLACADRGCTAIATDADERAGAFVGRSARANSVSDRISFACFDVTNGNATQDLGALVPRRPDALVAADVLYDDDLADAVLRLARDMGVLTAIALPTRERSGHAEAAAIAAGFTASRLAGNVRLLLRG